MRLEDALEILFGDARTVVADFEIDVLALLEIVGDPAAVEISPIGVKRTGTDFDASAVFGKAFAGVRDQVQQHLAQVLAVDFDQGQAGFQRVDEPGRPRRGRLDQQSHLVNGRREIDRVHLGRILTRVGEHLPGQCSRAISSPANHFDSLADRRSCGQIKQREVDVADNRREEIVERVSKPAGQRAQTLESLAAHDPALAIGMHIGDQDRERSPVHRHVAKDHQGASGVFEGAMRVALEHSRPRVRVGVFEQNGVCEK